MQWDIGGHQTGPTYDGSYIVFSPDHTQVALCNRTVITVQISGSRETVAELYTANDYPVQDCCFSLDGRLVAVAASETIYVWDITSTVPHLIETFVGHTNRVTSLAFSSSHLISASHDQSVKFWQIGSLSTDQAATGPESTQPVLASIESVNLQARDGVAISSDSAGVVKTWDVLTGLCKASFQTPAKGSTWRDVQLMDNKLTFVWYDGTKIHTWDTEKGELDHTLDASVFSGLRISGDESKLFWVGNGVIQAWNMQTWRCVDEVKLKGNNVYLDPFCAGNSKIWVRFGDLSIQGWDFGTSESPPVPLCKAFTERPYCQGHSSP